MTFFNSFKVIAGTLLIVFALMISVSLIGSGNWFGIIAGFALMLLTLTLFVYIVSNEEMW